MTTLTVTEAKAHFLELIRDSDRRLERFVITKQGKPKAVLMNADEFEGWLETLEIVSDKKALKEIRKAKKELEEGKTKSFKEVVGRPQKQIIMTHPIRFSNTAAKQFQKLKDKKPKERIASALEFIAKEPLIGKPLQAEFKGCYSYRIGDHRVIYAFSKNKKYVGIIRIEHRKDAYR